MRRKKVAEDCSVDIKTVYRWETAVAIPSDKLAMLDELGFDLLYVLLGRRFTSHLNNCVEAGDTENSSLGTKGYEKVDVDDKTGTQRPPYGPKLGRDEAQWLEWYRQIEPDDRAIVEPVVRGFAERMKQKKEAG